MGFKSFHFVIPILPRASRTQKAIDMAIMIRAETMKSFDLRRTNTKKAKKSGTGKTPRKENEKNNINEYNENTKSEYDENKDESKSKEHLTVPSSRVIHPAAIFRSLPRSNLRLTKGTDWVVHPNPTPSGLGVCF